MLYDEKGVKKRGGLYIKQYLSSQCQQTLVRTGKQACELLRLGDLNIQKQIRQLIQYSSL